MKPIKVLLKTVLLLFSLSPSCFAVGNILNCTAYTVVGRPVNTVFQNTTGNPLWITIAGGAGTDNKTGAVGSTGSPGSITSPTVQWTEQNGSNGVNSPSGTSMMFVPNNWYYTSTSATTTVFSNSPHWLECQITTGTLNGYNTDLGPSGSATRTTGTIYTNNTGHGIFVLANVGNLNNSVTINGYVNGENVYTGQGGTIGFGGFSYTTQCVPLPVPAGATYEVTISGGSTTSWYEVDFGSNTDFYVNPQAGNSFFKVDGTVSGNVSGVAAFILRPVSISSGDPLQALMDSSNPPTTVESSFEVKYALKTSFVIVPNGQYVKFTLGGSVTTTDCCVTHVWGVNGPITTSGSNIIAPNFKQFANP